MGTKFKGGRTLIKNTWEHVTVLQFLKCHGWARKLSPNTAITTQKLYLYLESRLL